MLGYRMVTWIPPTGDRSDAVSRLARNRQLHIFVGAVLPPVADPGAGLQVFADEWRATEGHRCLWA